MASLSDLISRVQFFIDETTFQNFTQAAITYAINVAQQDVAKEIVHEYEDFFEVQSLLNPSGGGTIPTIEFYTLPSDFLKFKRIERNDTNEPIPPIDQNEKVWNNYSLATVVTQNSPLSYYVMGTSVGFNPVPQTAIPVLMTYVQRLPDLVNLADVSPIPSEHHDMIAVQAAIDMMIKDEADTTAMQNRYNQLLNSLQRTLRDRQIQEPKRVRRTEISYGVLN